MKTIRGSCEGVLDSADRRKAHGEHWKPFDRLQPPPWLKLGQVGIDDKRESSANLAKTSRRVHPPREVSSSPAMLIRTGLSLSKSRPRRLSQLVSYVLALLKSVGNYGMGYTMRFPRCRFIYWDKASRPHGLPEDSVDRDLWNAVSLYIRFVADVLQLSVDGEYIKFCSRLTIRIQRSAEQAIKAICR
jgi:hypothetical protein